jgi:WbqC-like protein family
MSKTVVILQSNYLPWRGYFDLIRRADEFIFLDIVQFTKNDWRNRNRIKAPSGSQWLTIPVRHSLASATAIDQTLVADKRWAEKHAKSIAQNYSRAASYSQEADWLFQQLSAVASEESLTVINQRLISAIAKHLGIQTTLRQCTDFIARDVLIEMDPTARLLALCKTCGATHYLSGPAAKAYLDTGVFSTAGIDVAWMSYDGYPNYNQLWGDFDAHMSIVDLILNTGASASRYFPPV